MQATQQFKTIRKRMGGGGIIIFLTGQNDRSIVRSRYIEL